MDVIAQVEYVARALERKIVATKVGLETSFTWRIEQTCPVCDVIIGVAFYPKEIVDAEWLFAQMFGLYDEHRCRVAPARVAECRARAERESERLAERAGVIRERERDEPPRDLPSLYERAERESVVLGEWAARMR